MAGKISKIGIFPGFWCRSVGQGSEIDCHVTENFKVEYMKMLNVKPLATVFSGKSWFR